MAAGTVECDLVETRIELNRGPLRGLWELNAAATSVARGELVDGEETTPLDKLMLADSSNGVGSVLDFQRFVFMNTDTVVHLHRLPVGEDFALRARGSIGPDRVGVTSAEIFDRSGFIGVCTQTLLVQRR